MASEGIKELIERLEKADGPSRQLDFAIARIVMPWLANAEITESLDGEDGIWWKSPDAKPDPSRTYHGTVDRYTASLDAAMQLVPEGWEWELRWNGGIAYASLGDPRLWMEGASSSPAIALTIACLKARESQP